jgi:hypothetical protein
MKGIRMSDFKTGYDDAVDDIKINAIDPFIGESGEIAVIYCDVPTNCESVLKISADYSDSYIDGYLDACLNYINEKSA